MSNNANVTDVIPEAANWTEYQNYWACYAWKARGSYASIQKGLLIAGFFGEEILDKIKKEEASSQRMLLRGSSSGVSAKMQAFLDAKVLSAWAAPFACFCQARAEAANKTWDAALVTKYTPMKDNADFFGAVAVNFELATASLFIRSLYEAKGNVQSAGKIFAGVAEKNCVLVGTGLLAGYLTYIGDAYYFEVLKGIAKAVTTWFTDAVEEAVEKGYITEEDAKDLPPQLEKEGKYVITQIEEDCDCTWKKGLAFLKKQYAAEQKLEESDAS